jgi:hypothetical protein
MCVPKGSSRSARLFTKTLSLRIIMEAERPPGALDCEAPSGNIKDQPTYRLAVSNDTHYGGARTVLVAVSSSGHRTISTAS